MPRMDNFQDLFARLAKMGALHQSLGSAHIPLLGFESTGGTVEDPEYTAAASSANHHLAGEARNIQDIVTGGYKPQVSSGQKRVSGMEGSMIEAACILLALAVLLRTDFSFVTDSLQETTSGLLS
jgi:hypothetical protein